MKQQRYHKLRWTAAGVLLGIAALVGAGGQAVGQTVGQEGSRAGNLSEHAAVVVPLGKARVIELTRPVSRVTLGNEGIAKAVPLDSRRIQLIGMGLGTTNVLFWDNRGALVDALNLEVSHDLNALKEKLSQLLPGEPIEVYSSQGSIVLSGEISASAKMDAAVAIARSFLPGKDEQGKGGEVLNLMQVGGAQQVMLEVQVAEISRQLTKRFGIKFNLINPGGNWTWGAVSGGARFPPAVFDNVPLFNPMTGEFMEFADDVSLPVFKDLPYGPMIPEFVPNPLSIADKGLFASFLNDNLLFNMVMDIAKEQGLAKILAEPTLTTLSGQEASFLAGGEFPIPVAEEEGKITIEYKEYGIGLRFLPVVLDSGTIDLKVNITVSEISNANSVTVGFSNVSSALFVPSLKKRSANASISLASGQTMGIAGLINEDMRERVDKFPVLGDVPVLGGLFRSQEYVKGQTELVIFVTPHFAQPIRPEQIRLPTDNFVEPDDVDFYLLGTLEGRPRTDGAAPPPANSGTGGLEGKFGHQL
jgi:pilus assembly protein CpaC